MLILFKHTFDLGRRLFACTSRTSSLSRTGSFNEASRRDRSHRDTRPAISLFRKRHILGMIPPVVTHAVSSHTTQITLFHNLAHHGSRVSASVANYACSPCIQVLSTRLTSTPRHDRKIVRDYARANQGRSFVRGSLISFVDPGRCLRSRL